MRATVIIPTFGRPAAAKEAIRSLLAIDPRSSEAEILVVDNNIDPSLSADLRAACAAAGEPVRYVAEPSPGLSAARHRGAREARGEILIFIDDDVRVSAGWLEAYMGAFADAGVGMAGGPSAPHFTAPVPAWLESFNEPTPYGGWSCGWLSLIDIGRDVGDIDPVWIWGLNFAIRRDVLFQLRGFHPDLVPAALQRWQGDGETGLSLKAKAAGVKCVHVHGASLQHVVGADRLTAEYFAKRAYYQGVCDSFTRVRAGLAPSPKARGPRRPRLFRRDPGEAARAVRTRADAAYNEGWMFHQREAATDPQLLAWVRREDYLDADIGEELRKRGAAPHSPSRGPEPGGLLDRAGSLLHGGVSAIAPKLGARIEARRAFGDPAHPPILVYQMGKVGSTTVVESLRRAGLRNAILHVHAISDDVAEYRKTHLEAGAGNPYHLDLGEAIALEMARKPGTRLKVISLVRDPIAVQVSGLFEVPEFVPEEVRSATSVIDARKAAEYLRASLAEPGALNYIFNWFDREMARVFAIDVFALPFPKERGAAVLRSEKADLLLLRLEDLDRIGASAIGEFLGLGKPLELVAANVRGGKPEAQAYQALGKQLDLDPALCGRIYASRFATHFYSPAELVQFAAKWSRRAPA